MITVGYVPAFLKKLALLEPGLYLEAKEKIELLKERSNHKQLRVHKLEGKLVGCYAFSVNYKTRIVFEYLNNRKQEIRCLDVGSHDVYQ